VSQESKLFKEVLLTLGGYRSKPIIDCIIGGSYEMRFERIDGGIVELFPSVLTGVSVDIVAQRRASPVVGNLMRCVGSCKMS